MPHFQWLDLILHADQSLDFLVRQYGNLIYVPLFLIIFCETGLVILPFLPGDSLLFIAGAFCANGMMNIGLLTFLLVIAAVTGNTLNYLIGRTIGHKMMAHHYRWFNPSAVHKTHLFFEKHGGKAVILGRFVPLLRSFSPFVAGISEMDFFKFQMFNIIGGLFWVTGLLMCGYLFGNIPIIRDHLNAIVLIGVGVAIVPLLLAAIWQSCRSRHLFRK